MPEGSRAHVTIRGVSKGFVVDEGEVEALGRIDLRIPRGQFVCLIGASGCGKSTMLRIIAGFEEPTTGEVLVEDTPIAGPGSDRGMVFQDYALFPWMTVRQNVGFGPRQRRLPRREVEQIADEFVHLVGLERSANRYPSQLSGGMKQRVAIARGLVQNPAVLLMDEPFASLDEQTRMVLGDELLRIWAETRKTVLFVTHSLNEAVYLADRVVVLSARPGRMVDDVLVDLPRPRSFAMTGTERFGMLKDRIWQHIKSAERR
jgi:NitT/TauT family transport system ATP-binding protein